MMPQPTRPRLEVADIFRLHGDEYRSKHNPSTAKLQVMNHVQQCRTATLGGHMQYCSSCGYIRISYNSCRDRHCPKCQSLKKDEWLQMRLKRLLPALYFHLVFTLPSILNPLILRNKKLLFDLLFQAASQTLIKIAADDKHLGAEIGFTAVLHSWGQKLLFHPHLHCVVTGGGLDKSGKRWIKARPNFFLSVKVLGKLFRGKFIDGLQKARRKGKLDFGGAASELAHERTWNKLINELYQKDWVVYAKRPFGGAENVFRYLGRYTHRVAISNHRLLHIKDGRITFWVKDYADGAKKKKLTLDAVEFIRRFLLHVLPKGYTRIRHYGLFAGVNVHTKLEYARHILEPQTKEAASDQTLGNPKIPWWERLLKLTGFNAMVCPHCGCDRFTRFPFLPGFDPSAWVLSAALPILDSS